MSLLRLPNDVLFMIADLLTARQVVLLLQSDPVYHFLNGYLLARYLRTRASDAHALNSAAAHDADEVVQRLLDSGVDVSWKTTYWSCSSPDPDAPFRRRITPEARQTYKLHPLLFAAGNGRTGIVAKLLDHGADINAKDPGGNSPLMLAAYYGHLDTVRTLVERGANLLAVNCEGARAMGRSAHRRLDEISDFLDAALQRKYPSMHRVRQKELHQLLWYAARDNDFDRVRDLLARGAEIDYQLPLHDTTALTVAIARASPEMAQLLLEHGASPNASLSPRPGPPRPTDPTLTLGPLGCALEREQSYRFIELLIEHGQTLAMDVAHLERALTLGKLNEFRLLVDTGADIVADPRIFIRLYHRAVRLQHGEIINMLYCMRAELLEIDLPLPPRPALTTTDRRYPESST
ncbi:ankyrin [Aspergillus indologenus CBS 114.80]|uniref:Ankyrin n=1 Tax=Aspergillus indologenus CBS 114.80 TaxID=1450541 RepID=A0A2V5IXA3_9EURO|nr:ankyrin [Aspergillus indologenus CBS 114.80]